MNPIFNAADTSRQFLLLGDTNHESIALRRQTHSLAFITEAAQLGYKSIFIEASETIQHLSEKLAVRFRENLGERYKPAIVDTALDALGKNMGMGEKDLLTIKLMMLSDAAGIKAFCADPRSEQEKGAALMLALKDAQAILTGSQSTGILNQVGNWAESRDDKLADTILEKSGADKAIVIYGSAHFRTGSVLDQRIPEDKRSVINLYDGNREITRQAQHDATADTLHYDVQTQTSTRPSRPASAAHARPQPEPKA